MSKPVEGDNPETYEMVTKALKVGTPCLNPRVTIWPETDRLCHPLDWLQTSRYRKPS
jgi:hypothetical protein